MKTDKHNFIEHLMNDYDFLHSADLQDRRISQRDY